MEMECAAPWSNRDEYFVYSTCHVWTPYYKITGVIVIALGVINSLVAFSRLHMRDHRLLPLCAGLSGLIFALVYMVRVATGLTLGDKNPALNLFFGLGMACISIVLTIVIGSYLEVVLLTEKLKRHTEVLLYRFHLTVRIFMVVIVFMYLLVTLVPCFTAMNMRDSFYSWLVCMAGLHSCLLYYFGFSVRNLLKSMEVSKSFYAGLIKKIDTLLIPWTLKVPIALLMMILFMTVPFLQKNNYILMNTIMVIGQSLNSIILYTTTPSHAAQQHEHSSDGHKSGGSHSHKFSSAGASPQIGSTKECPGLHTTDLASQPVGEGEHLDSSSHPMTPHIEEHVLLTVARESPQPPSSTLTVSLAESSRPSTPPTDRSERGTSRLERMQYEDPELGIGNSRRVLLEDLEKENDRESLALSQSQSCDNLLDPSLGTGKILWNPHLEKQSSQSSPTE